MGCQAVERSELFDAGTPAAHIAYNCERNRPVVALAMWDEAAELKKPREMVLPVRIELTTSPLPRGCSTTELRQRRAGCENRGRWKTAASAAILAIRLELAQARAVQ